jgi:hypothetical protein
MAGMEHFLSGTSAGAGYTAHHGAYFLSAIRVCLTRDDLKGGMSHTGLTYGRR